MSNFFSRANFHNFVWALIGAFALFLCGLIWNWWNGPDEVKIVAGDLYKKDTTITIVKFEPIDLSKSNISYAKDEFPHNTSSYQFSPALIDTVIKMLLAKHNVMDNSITSVSNSIPSETVAEVVRPFFAMPAIVLDTLVVS